MTISIKEFLLARGRSTLAAALNPQPSRHRSLLADEVRTAANRGLRIFPAPALSADPNFLVGEATCQLSRLEEMAALYPHCGWRAATDPALLILQIDGNAGWGAAAFLSRYDQEECLTLQARRGDSTWAIFLRPKRLAPLSAAKKLADGLTVLGGRESCPIPPSAGCAWVDASAELSAAPYWLRALVFDTPDDPLGKAAPVPAPSARLNCSRPAHAVKRDSPVRKGWPTCNHAGWRRGYRICRQR